MTDLRAKTEAALTATLDEWTAAKRIRDYRYFNADEIIITPKVRLKCMNGCPNYGVTRKCPPGETLSPEQCKSYLREYDYGLLLRFYPDPNQIFPIQAQTDLLELEYRAFLLNNPFAIAIFPTHCMQCRECIRDEPCKNPVKARFSVSSMCIDILGTTAKFGLRQSILTEKRPANEWYYIGLVFID